MWQITRRLRAQSALPFEHGDSHGHICSHRRTLAALAAYGFATMEFRGRELLFAAFLGLLLIPWTLTLIPLFAEMRGFRLYGNWGALVLPYATAAQPLLIFLDRAFFEGIPKEILMSARVDGASEIQVLRRIVVPLARPVLLMGAILIAISAWGDYIWPQVVLPNQSKMTISAGMQYFVDPSGFRGREEEHCLPPTWWRLSPSCYWLQRPCDSL